MDKHTPGQTMSDKTSIATRPNGRIRAAFIVPVLLALLAVVAIVWQSWHGPS
jgi:hypothetical protein